MATGKTILPRKAQGLHVQELDGEFVVVDSATQQAHALSGTAAALWTGIDAGRWPEASDEDLDLAVAELQTLGLIESAGLSRRNLMRGGTIAVAGAVITIGLPSVAMAGAQASPSSAPRRMRPHSASVALPWRPGRTMRSNSMHSSFRGPAVCRFRMAPRSRCTGTRGRGTRGTGKAPAT